jgi:hypothetical protein
MVENYMQKSTSTIALMRRSFARVRGITAAGLLAR